ATSTTMIAITINSSISVNADRLSKAVRGVLMVSSSRQTWSKHPAALPVAGDARAIIGKEQLRPGNSIYPRADQAGVYIAHDYADPGHGETLGIHAISAGGPKRWRDETELHGDMIRGITGRKIGAADQGIIRPVVRPGVRILKIGARVLHAIARRGLLHE